MKIVRAQANARAALAGNPSDGYGGKTLSYTLQQFAARVVIYEWHELEIIPPPSEGVRFASLDDLRQTVGRNGYYGAVRLIKASLKRFADYCDEKGIALPNQPFSIRYETNVPRGVGMAGSSAIITATFRGLMEFYGVDIPLPILPNWVLSVEKQELRIEGGLQDRVAQAFGGLTFMDFDADFMSQHGHGRYESLDPNLLPPLYLAYQSDLAEPSDVVHNNLRARFDAGEKSVHDAMDELKIITETAKSAILSRQAEVLARAVDANFEVRKRIMAISPGHQKMIDTARKNGASANFSGSGGAITGTYDGTRAHLDRLKNSLGELGCRVVVPEIR